MSIKTDGALFSALVFFTDADVDVLIISLNGFLFADIWLVSFDGFVIVVTFALSSLPFDEFAFLRTISRLYVPSPGTSPSSR